MTQPLGGVAPETTTEGGEPLTESKINDMISKAIGARLKPLQKELGDQITASMKQLQETFAPMLQPKPETTPGDKGGKGGTDPEDNPRIRGLEKLVADLKRDNDLQKEAVAAERAKSRNQALRTSVTEALGKRGITDPVRIKHALHTILDGEKLAAYASDDEDELVWRDSNGDIEFQAGLDSWWKENGKYFLPPTGTRGSGAEPRQGARNPNTQPGSNEPSMTDLGLAIVKEFGGVPVG